jgi:hypothetical protein
MWQLMPPSEVDTSKDNEGSNNNPQSFGLPFRSRRPPPRGRPESRLLPRLSPAPSSSSPPVGAAGQIPGGASGGGLPLPSHAWRARWGGPRPCGGEARWLLLVLAHLRPWGAMRAAAVAWRGRHVILRDRRRPQFWATSGSADSGPGAAPGMIVTRWVVPSRSPGWRLTAGAAWIGGGGGGQI